MLKKLVTTCDSSACPTIWKDDELPVGEVIVQGYVVSDQLRSRMSLPSGEEAVVIPVDIISEMALLLQTREVQPKNVMR